MLGRVRGAGVLVGGLVVVLLGGCGGWGGASGGRLRAAERTPGRPHLAAVAAVADVPLGASVAILRIPRFGPDYAPVVVEGVGVTDLQEGPGHYPGTALPGQLGNVVVSGHRTTYSHPFGRLDELRTGDPIVVDVADRSFTYRVTQSLVVAPDDLAAILPVPNHPGARPTRRLLTLTTCTPKFSASSRLVIHAELTATTMTVHGPLPPPGRG
jgi:sortase A